MWSPILRDRLPEEPWPPLMSFLLSRIGFLALPLFELLFYIRGLCIPLLEDRCCHTVPKAARFVRELLVFGGDYLRDGPERLEVYELAEFGILVAVLVPIIARSGCVGGELSSRRVCRRLARASSLRFEPGRLSLKHL
jgi:hypothetical protein